MRGKGIRRIMPIISWAALILLAINLAAIAYPASFNLNAFDEKFYTKEFKKYSIYEKFPNNDIDRINSEILQYISGRKDKFNAELFNEKEISHFKDVKATVKRVNASFYSALILSILLLAALFLLDRSRFLKNIAVASLFGGLLALALATIILASVKLNFSGIFTAFHYIFFPQGNWLFSSSENIVNLYPSELFYDISGRIFIDVILYSILLIALGILPFLLRKWNVISQKG